MQTERVRVRFYPQEWQESYGEKVAVPATADEPGASYDPATFYVPVEDALVDGRLPEDDSYESDTLHEHENAPEWVQNWEGPFYVSLREVE